MVASLEHDKTTWYVFTSTRWQMVNLLPAAAIGLDKIHRLLILVPKSGRGASPDVDKQHAELPKAAIIQAMHLEKKTGAKLDANALEGDLDDIGHWRRVVPEFFAARPGPLEIIFNYTGGTKDVSIGVLLGLQELARDRDDITVRFVAKHAHHMTWPFENIREPVAPGRNTVSLDAYLLAHGYREFAPEQRQAREREALRREALTREIAEQVFSGGDAATDAHISLLNGLTAQTFNDLPGMTVKVAEAVARSRGYPTGSLDRGLLDFTTWLAEALAKTKGAERSGSKLHISAPMKKFLGGDWFEDWLWLRAHHTLASSAAEVHLDVTLSDTHDEALQRGEKDMQIDVGIFCGDQLHAIECKTGVSNDIQKELDHLARVKDAVIGPFGKAWLMRARALQSAKVGDANGADTPAKSYAMAKRLGLQIAAGASEIEAVCGALPKLAESSR